MASYDLTPAQRDKLKELCEIADPDADCRFIKYPTRDAGDVWMIMKQKGRQLEVPHGMILAFEADGLIRCEVKESTRSPNFRVRRTHYFDLLPAAFAAVRSGFVKPVGAASGVSIHVTDGSNAQVAIGSGNQLNQQVDSSHAAESAIALLRDIAGDLAGVAPEPTIKAIEEDAEAAGEMVRQGDSAGAMAAVRRVASRVGESIDYVGGKADKLDKIAKGYERVAQLMTLLAAMLPQG